MTDLNWPEDDIPECLNGYQGQYSVTEWYKAVSETFRRKCPTGRHFRYMKFYSNCFLASDAVTWLQKELKTSSFKAHLTRPQTLKILQMMQNLDQMFEDVRGNRKEQIKDNRKLYRFCEYIPFGVWDLPRELMCTSQTSGISFEDTGLALNIPTHSVAAEVGHEGRNLQLANYGGNTEAEVQIGLDQMFNKVNLFVDMPAGNLHAAGRFQFEQRSSTLDSHGPETLIKLKQSNMQHSESTALRSIENCLVLPEGDSHKFHKKSRILRASEHLQHTEQATLQNQRLGLQHWNKGDLGDRKRAAQKVQKNLSDNHDDSMLDIYEALNFTSTKSMPVRMLSSKMGNKIADRNESESDEESFVCWFDASNESPQKFEQRQTHSIKTMKSKQDQHENYVQIKLGNRIDLDMKILDENQLVNTLSNSLATMGENDLLNIFKERLQCFLSVNDLNEVFDVDLINPVCLYCNLVMKDFDIITKDEDKYPDWVLEAMDSFANWPWERISDSSRLQGLAFSLMESYFTTSVEPLFTYKLYHVFINVTETLLKHVNVISASKPEGVEKEKQKLQRTKLCSCCQSKLETTDDCDVENGLRMILTGFDSQQKGGHQLLHKHSTKMDPNRNRNSRHNDDSLPPVTPVSNRYNKSLKLNNSTMWQLCQTRSISNKASENSINRYRQSHPKQRDISAMYRTLNASFETEPSLSALGSSLSQSSDSVYETAHSSLTNLNIHLSERSSETLLDTVSRLERIPGYQSSCEIITSPTMKTLRLKSKCCYFSQMNHGPLISEASVPKLIKVLQLCCLLLSPGERQRILTFFCFIAKLLSNPNIEVEGVGCKCQLVLGRFTTALFSCKDRNQYNLPASMCIFMFMIDHYEKIMEIPQDFAATTKHEPQFNSDNQGKTSNIPAYCKQVSRHEYELQRNGGTEHEIQMLLNYIVNNKFVSTKARQKQLKKFEATYPEIYYRHFPPTAVSPPLHCVRVPSFQKSLNLLRNLRL